MAEVQIPRLNGVIRALEQGKPAFAFRGIEEFMAAAGAELEALQQALFEEARARREANIVRDIATFDTDGYLKIVGRMDSRISRGNEHILPEEVESLLHRHPAVSLAAVVEVPHPFHGHDGKAFVTLKSDLKPEQQIEAATLLQWLKKQLPDGQSPGELEIRESLPMTNTGKIARHVLAQSAL